MAVKTRSKHLGLLSVTVVALLTMSGPAFTGDDDKAPAYMIYIDPQTGKYTTTRPHSAGTANSSQQPAQAPDARAMSDVRPPAAGQATADPQPESVVQRSNLPIIIAGASVIAGLLVAGIVRTQRKQLHSG